MTGKEIVQTWFGLERPPHAEYLALSDMIDSALAEEREACAMIAENPKNWTRHGGTTGDAIARDIRARSTP